MSPLNAKPWRPRKIIASNMIFRAFLFFPRLLFVSSDSKAKIFLSVWFIELTHSRWMALLSCFPRAGFPFFQLLKPLTHALYLFSSRFNVCIVTDLFLDANWHAVKIANSFTLSYSNQGWGGGHFFEPPPPLWPKNETASASRLFAQKSKTPPLPPPISFERLKIW